MKTAFIFPGQGSQTIGMGKDLYDNFPIAKQVFEQVDDALDQRLSALMFGGEEANLTKTQNAQPAIMAVGIAALRVLETEAGKSITDMAACVAGHSLGEYTALCAAKALTLPHTAKLLRARGLAMAEASLQHPGAMAAILGLSKDKVAEILARTPTGEEVCVIANDNCPGQIVISGHYDAVMTVMEVCKAAGAKRAIKLAVSGAFHSPLMQSAADEMKEVLSKITFQNPVLPVVANVTAQFVQEADQIKELLARQVTGSVLWTDSLSFMAQNGITNFVELGNGKILNGLVKKTAPEATVTSLGTPTEIMEFLGK